MSEQACTVMQMQSHTRRKIRAMAWPTLAEFACTRGVIYARVPFVQRHGRAATAVEDNSRKKKHTA